MARIQRLPDALVNQIAAGEVVERPASVVKELVENALDAGAHSVRVRLVAGGRELVEVSDDGCGMGADDAALAIERHATSKIASAEDLDRIASLGFRGEALPSIASVSRFALETAAADGEGTRVEVEFGHVVEVRPCSRARGTTVAVQELFARLPARRKFLRTEATELRHATAALAALSLTRPEVAFNLEHGTRALLSLPAVREIGQRLPDLVGAERARKARPVRHVRGEVRVEGWLLPPSAAREVVIAVNGRTVRDRLLAGTVNRALRGPSGAPEADAYLAIDLPASAVDVNVHPAKSEVRFAEPGRVLAALTQALAAARLALHGPAEVRRIVTVPAAAPQRPLPLSHAVYPPAPPFPPAGVREAEPASPSATPTPWGRYIGQYRETYLTLEDNDGLVLVDQHAAHERVLYERLLARDAAPAVQRLLLPEVVELPPTLAALAEDAVLELERLGVEIEVASGASVRLLGLPASLPGAQAGRLVAQLLADLADGTAPGQTLRERAAASLSCRAAIKKNRPLPRAEAERLLAELAEVQEPHRCPHGRPTMIRLEQAEIERRIGRR
jgi:DNA mismatch repair protein MutL